MSNEIVIEPGRVLQCLQLVFSDVSELVSSQTAVVSVLRSFGKNSYLRINVRYCNYCKYSVPRCFNILKYILKYFGMVSDYLRTYLFLFRRQSADITNADLNKYSENLENFIATRLPFKQREFGNIKENVRK